MFKTPKDAEIETAYAQACQRYAQFGVDAERALKRLASLAVSIHCWQGDDVTGFEGAGGLSDGGIQVTGNYPGRARNADELRRDLDKAMSLIPGRHRANLHALYAETAGRRVERNALAPEHFAAWIDWAKQRNIGLDFNGTFFSHPKAASGFTLASRDEGIRRFWIEHAVACRHIGLHMGRQLGSPCVTNLWIPDGSKDLPADRKGPREILRRSLDEIFAENLDRACLLDAVECKLFGIGSESYVVGSHEFYLGYAAAHGLLLCLDAGHFHPTETISDKISSVLTFLDELLLHVSRGVRWDSDHVVILSDEMLAIAQEIVRGDYLSRVHLALDYFDGSINRIAAWVIGTRAALKAMLVALLEPVAMLQELEANGDHTARLALMEECKSLPASAVWNYHCLRQGVPVGPAWIDDVRAYERDELSRRG
ncbi:MAG TPA: L-rhamnose isomerase [Phycisphaerae bacterium]|nr:L-rhamnose isomerase [Phycisphaerae bacterium]